MDKKLEKRTLLFKGGEFRAETVDGVRHVKGYPVVFGVKGNPYRYSDWSEVVDSNALSDVDLSDLMLLLGHDDNQLLARNGINLTFKIDSTGLFIDATLGNTELDNYVYDRVSRGLLDSMSFRFYADLWQTDYDKKIDTILHITDLPEVSLVTWAAYQQTVAIATEETVSKREQELKGKADADKRAKALFDLELSLI